MFSAQEKRHEKGKMKCIWSKIHISKKKTKKLCQQQQQQELGETQGKILFVTVCSAAQQGP